MRQHPLVRDSNRFKIGADAGTKVLRNQFFSAL